MFKRIFIILIAAFIFVQYVGTSHGASSDSSNDNYLDQYRAFEFDHTIDNNTVLVNPIYGELFLPAHLPFAYDIYPRTDYLVGCDVGAEFPIYITPQECIDQGGEILDEIFKSFCLSKDPFFYAIYAKRHKQFCGMASYLRITPEHGSIEVGHINYSPILQNTAEGTETMYLMKKNAFEVLGNRRYEWKCNNLNTASKKAAKRLGFKFEGVFRQATIYKNRNRDTAWYSIIDKEWPNYKKKYFPPKSFLDRLYKKFSPYCSVATWYLWRSIDNEPIQY